MKLLLLIPLAALCGCKTNQSAPPPATTNTPPVSTNIDQELNPLPALLPGDCLLYGNSGGIVDFIISTKSWSPVVHCECYIGAGTSVASRNGIGIRRFPFRSAQLAYVLRPKTPVDMRMAMDYFDSVNGEDYDWLGLFCFFIAAWQSSKSKQFCSEFLKNFYEHGKFEAIKTEWDADRTAPAQYLQTPAFDWIWQSKPTQQQNQRSVTGVVTPQL